MQGEQRGHSFGQRCSHGVKVLGALGQDQNLVAPRIGIGNFVHDGGGASGVDCQCPEYILDAGTLGQLEGRGQITRNHLQGLRCPPQGGPPHGVLGRTA